MSLIQNPYNVSLKLEKYLVAQLSANLTIMDLTIAKKSQVITC